MPDVVSVRFKSAGPIYYFDPAGLDLKVGDWVIVDTARGQSMGRIIVASTPIPDGELQEPLKAVVRKAEPEELGRVKELKVKEEEALKKCAELITKHELPMKAVTAEYNFDSSHLTIYFRAEEKVDFRALLKELGSVFKTRVELRQVGARDVAKLLGGSGRCGQPLCCTRHLSKFDPITVRMARDQDLPLNPAMISGLCGKLLCCLKYEHEQYLAMKASLPGKGKMVMSPHGLGKVVKVNPIKQTVMVQLESAVTLEFSAQQVKLQAKGE
ncbi:MAG: stage 0 sporulation family protein [Dehalococcoidia bacterium]|nr:stage 0 sporulation family protein [Dehalococcoidia bacterium]